MTYAELVARDKSLTDAKNILVKLQIDTTDYAHRKLSSAWMYVRTESIAVGKELNAYFEVSA